MFTQLSKAVHLKGVVFSCSMFLSGSGVPLDDDAAQEEVRNKMVEDKKTGDVGDGKEVDSDVELDEERLEPRSDDDDTWVVSKKKKNSKTIYKMLILTELQYKSNWHLDTVLW